jgi:PPOX class probable F420-dependent enzyme
MTDPVTAVPDWAADLLGQGRVARLGTADAAGRPLVVPVCFAFDGRHLYSAVDAKPKRTGQLRRLRNIAENPRVSLLVDCYDEDWTRLAYVVVEGQAEVLRGGGEFTRGIDLLLEKYAQYRTMGLDRASGALIKIKPDRVLAWRSAAGA